MTSVGAHVERIKAHTDLPIAIGFGVKSPEQVRDLARVAEGVVVGSALVAAIADTLTRIRGYFERSTAYRLVDTSSGQPVRDLTAPSRDVGLDAAWGSLNDWTPAMGVVLAGMLRAGEVTGMPLTTVRSSSLSTRRANTHSAGVPRASLPVVTLTFRDSGGFRIPWSAAASR